MYAHDLSLIRRNLESPVPATSEMGEIYSSNFIPKIVFYLRKINCLFHFLSSSFRGATHSSRVAIRFVFLSLLFLRSENQMSFISAVNTHTRLSFSPFGFM